jgi:hypothetical protein
MGTSHLRLWTAPSCARPKALAERETETRATGGCYRLGERDLSSQLALFLSRLPARPPWERSVDNFVIRALTSKAGKPDARYAPLRLARAAEALRASCIVQTIAMTRPIDLTSLRFRSRSWRMSLSCA